MSPDYEAVPYPFAEPEGLDIHLRYGELRQAEGMAVVQPPYGGCAYLAVRYDDVRAVLADPRFSRAGSVGEDEPRVHPFVPRPDALSAMDPPEHTRLRQALTAAFTVRRMSRLRPRVAELVDEGLDAVEKQGRPADLVSRFSRTLPIRVICEVLGVSFADRDTFSRWASMTLATAASGVTQEEIGQARGQMFAYLADLVARRRAEPADDLLGVLAQCDEEGHLTEQEMLGLASSVLVAGHETTANQISNICFVLLKDRDRWVELTRQPDLVPQAVEELLRVAPVTATAGFSRRALEDVQVGSQLVRAGERVMPTVFAANHDPAVFPDPDIVDFGRPNRTAHVAFSHGAHHCPGNQLARLELQVALEGLLRRFPGLDLAVPAGSIPWARSTLSRGPLCLPVTW